MTTKEYNNQATEYNRKLESLMTALSSCSAIIIKDCADGTNDSRSWKADEMYKIDLILDSLKSRLYKMSIDFGKLNAAYYEISLED